MIIEIVGEITGSRRIRAKGDVQVDYKSGKTVIYHSEKIKHLILNLNCITSVTVNEKKENQN